MQAYYESDNTDCYSEEEKPISNEKLVSRNNTKRLALYRFLLEHSTYANVKSYQVYTVDNLFEVLKEFNISKFFVYPNYNVCIVFDDTLNYHILKCFIKDLNIISKQHNKPPPDADYYEMRLLIMII